ncbi:MULTISPECIES: S8 family serine peptidase [Pseudoalteromonas]|uniref:S8 family serine peptidase n=1 Tax=Pseudoalteromonas TaxID=53246 RepID=UPI000C2D08CC|nr:MULTISPECIES: S8 family serine peptidase [Pseudoalteromonas]
MKNNKLKLSALSAAILISLAGCGSDDNKKSVTPDVAPTANDVMVSDAMQWMVFEGKLNARDGNYDELTVSFSENGETVTAQDGVYTFSHGVLELSGIDFKYVSISGEDAVIDYTVSANGKSASAQLVVSGVKGDPLAKHQWHLRNSGQKAFALSDSLKALLVQLDVGRGLSEEEAKAKRDAEFAADENFYLVAGEDMNVVEAYKHGVTGAGVTAVVVDSGLEIRHEDLAPNVLPNRSLNLNDKAIDRTDPTSTSESGDHGTSVAGLLAAKGWNGLGGRGVAPDTGLIGMNYLGGDKVPQTEFLVHGFPGSGISLNEEISAFNRSYGLTVPTHIVYSELDEAIESYPNKALRGGKGATNIKSSGNSFVDGGREGSFCEDNGANALGLTCYNGTSESSQAHPYYFSIGAVNSNGKHTSYSTAGANVLVAAPAGEYGVFAPAMVTTDSMTCLNGYSGYKGRSIVQYTSDFAAAIYPFDYPGHEENTSCNYTSTMNGTSSAAPNASGVVSLILSANNELTWRDVRHILATTSTKNDAENEAIKLAVGEGEFVAHDGWIENAAGYKFNNLYGFGRVDAGAAVAMAKSYSVDLGDEVITPWQGAGSVLGQEPLSLEIPDNNATGAEYKIVIEEELNIEAMQFKFDVFSAEMGFGFETDNGVLQTTAGTDLAIEVTSPSGTRSVLLSSKQALSLPALDLSNGWEVGYILKDGAFLSNAFYGESSKGEWTVRFLDTSDASFTAKDGGDSWAGFAGYVNNTTPSTMTGIAVRVFGNAAN